MQEYLGGKVDVSLNGITVPAKYISDEGVTTTLTEGTRDIPTMAGTFSQPSGTYDEATTMFNLVLPNYDYLKNIFPDLYEAGTGGQTVGRVVFGGDSCTVRENTPVVVHYSCEPNSDNDVFIPNGAVQASMELVQNTGDPVVVAVNIFAQPDEDGVIAWAGTGSLTEKTLWDAEAEEYVPVTS